MKKDGLTLENPESKKPRLKHCQAYSNFRPHKNKCHYKATWKFRPFDNGEIKILLFDAMTRDIFDVFLCDTHKNVLESTGAIWFWFYPDYDRQLWEYDNGEAHRIRHDVIHDKTRRTIELVLRSASIEAERNGYPTEEYENALEWLTSFRSVPYPSLIKSEAEYRSAISYIRKLKSQPPSLRLPDIELWTFLAETYKKSRGEK